MTDRTASVSAIDSYEVFVERFKFVLTYIELYMNGPDRYGLADEVIKGFVDFYAFQHSKNEAAQADFIALYEKHFGSAKSLQRPFHMYVDVAHADKAMWAICEVTQQCRNKPLGARSAWTSIVSKLLRSKDSVELFVELIELKTAPNFDVREAG